MQNFAGGCLQAELAIIFLGVSAAFFVEGYRQQLDQAQQLRQATSGIIAELARCGPGWKSFSRKTDLNAGKVSPGPVGFAHDPWIALRAACSMNCIASR